MHNYPPIYGLAGLAQTGKDTAAILLKDALGAQCLTFAEPVTIACANELAMTHNYFLSLAKNKALSNGLTKRQFMQQMGKYIRQSDAFYMVNHMHARLRAIQQPVIITDVRMPQEADYIRSRGGMIIHIKNPNAEPAPADETEQHLDHVKGDLLLTNDSDKLAYENNVRSLAIQLCAQMKEKAA